MKSLAILLLVGGSAWAQSKQYPAPPVDKDLEREQHSDLWDQTLSPQSKSYSDLLREAKHHLEERSDDEKIIAIHTLERAIGLLPSATDAYVMRGEAYLAIRQWPQCADDLAVADDKLGGGATCALKLDEGCLTERSGLRRELAICQSRAGRYGEAERTFMRAAASSTTTGELMMRLGEVRVAMGKLDEGIAALDTAADLTPDGMPEALIHWLLAVAYDRRRQPSDVDRQVEEALKYDRMFSTIENPALPLLGAGEREYMLGLAWRTFRPEYALVYFRRFVAMAPDSPWRKRADEHVRELASIEFPAAVTRESGSATLDVAAARAAAKKAMPAMRACMARLPFSVFQVRVTKAGAGRRAILRTPKPPGANNSPITVSPFTVSSIDPASDALAASEYCVKTLVEHMQLPRPNERDEIYTASFYVLAP